MPSSVSVSWLRASAALRIRPSRRGALSMNSYARDLTSLISERSPATTSRSASVTRLWIRSVAAEPRSAVRAPTRTRAPRSASSAAMASPTPLVAPVTRKVGRCSARPDFSVTGDYDPGLFDHDHPRSFDRIDEPLYLHRLEGLEERLVVDGIATQLGCRGLIGELGRLGHRGSSLYEALSSGSHMTEIRPAVDGRHTAHLVPAWLSPSKRDARFTKTVTRRAEGQLASVL